MCYLFNKQIHVKNRNTHIFMYYCNGIYFKPFGERFGLITKRLNIFLPFILKLSLRNLSH